MLPSLLSVSVSFGIGVGLPSPSALYSLQPHSNRPKGGTLELLLLLLRRVRTYVVVVVVCVYILLFSLYSGVCPTVHAAVLTADSRTGVHSTGYVIESLYSSTQAGGTRCFYDRVRSLVFDRMLHLYTRNAKPTTNEPCSSKQQVAARDWRRQLSPLGSQPAPSLCPAHLGIRKPFSLMKVL